MSTHPDDLIVWPDGTACYRNELPEFTHMSDDYEVFPYDSAKWHAAQEAIAKFHCDPRPDFHFEK